MSCRVSLAAHYSIRTFGPLVLGCLIVFSPLIDGGATHIGVLIVRLVLLATLTAWALGSMQMGWITVHIYSFYWAVLAFMVWAVVSVLQAPYTAASVQWLMSITSYAAWLFLVVHMVESIRQARLLLMVLLGMGLFEAAIGMCQFLWLGYPRVTGTFFNPNFFALYEAAVFILAFGMLCFNQSLPRTVKEKVFLWCTAGTTGIAFIMAQSRGALLAFVIGVGFVGCARYGRPFLAILLLGTLVIATIPNPLQQRVLSEERYNPLAYTRLDIWKDSLKRIADHPWGVGLGMYKYLSFQYRFPIGEAVARYEKRAESAHNEYLQMTVELGVVGLIIFLVSAGLLGKEIRETLAGPLEGWERGGVVGLAGGVLAVLVHASVDSVFHEPALVMLSVLFAGLVLVFKRLKAPQAATERRVAFPYRPSRAVLILVLAASLAVLSIRPAGAWYAFEAGERALSSGEKNRAMDWFEWAVRIDPGTSAYHDAQALAAFTLYRQSGDMQRLRQALESWQVGLELNPLDPRLAHRLGNLYFLLAEQADPGARREEMQNQAVTYYEQSVQLDRYSPFNYYELGRLRRAQGRHDEAQTWFRRATSYEPNFLPARVQLTELFLETGQEEAAATEYKEILEIQKRYQGRVLSPLERQFLNVKSDHLSRALKAEKGT